METSESPEALSELLGIIVAPSLENTLAPYKSLRSPPPMRHKVFKPPLSNFLQTASNNQMNSIPLRVMQHTLQSPLRECPRKAGCAWECLRECSRDPLSPGPKMCPKSDLKVSKKTLLSHFLKGPKGTSPDTFGHTPIFGDTLSDTLRGTSGPEGPEHSCRGPASSQPQSCCPLKLLQIVSFS